MGPHLSSGVALWPTPFGGETGGAIRMICSSRKFSTEGAGGERCAGLGEPCGSAVPVIAAVAQGSESNSSLNGGPPATTSADDPRVPKAWRDLADKTLETLGERHPFKLVFIPDTGAAKTSKSGNSQVKVQCLADGCFKAAEKKRTGGNKDAGLIATGGGGSGTRPSLKNYLGHPVYTPQHQKYVVAQLGEGENDPTTIKAEKPAAKKQKPASTSSTNSSSWRRPQHLRPPSSVLVVGDVETSSDECGEGPRRPTTMSKPSPTSSRPRPRRTAGPTTSNPILSPGTDTTAVRSVMRRKLGATPPSSAP